MENKSLSFVLNLSREVFYVKYEALKLFYDKLFRKYSPSLHVDY